MTRKEMAQVLLDKWVEINDASEDELNDQCLHWITHLFSNHHMEQWPKEVIRYTMEDGPNTRMRPRNAARFTVFFLGNWGSLLCAGTWILLRLANSNAKFKTRKAKRTIIRLLNLHKMVTNSGHRMKYFDMMERTYLTLKDKP